MPEKPDPQANSPEPDPEHDGRTVSDEYVDRFAHDDHAVEDTTPAVVPSSPPAPPPPPPPPPAAEKKEEEDDEEEGMLRMSFIGHLEELRSRLIRMMGGLGLAFIACIFFTNELWNAVRQPAVVALTSLGYPPDLAQLTPIEGFTIIWVKLPVLCAIFIASPWIIYQVWAFISPGLYKRERHLAVPFIFCTAGLFILGGAFAYFVAFRFGLTFLLGIGSQMGVRPYISLTEYFDLFVNVILGVALVFELPVLIFFLTLLRIASPRFLLRHSRYAILLITIAAAIITPTPDVVNLTIFAAPMILLYFVGVFASYLLVLRREGESFPWAPVLRWFAIVLTIIGGSLWLMIARFGYHWAWHWPFLLK
jgi:sec-independent protein translocase protein TatC